jgi:NADH dehydrogenase/NADH:ubiquinone oxidoreductase subunit G
MLNLRIRKHFFNKDVVVGYFGSITDLTYSVIHLGNSPKNLINILEGKHTFCQTLRRAKMPICILGSQIISRIDGFGLQQLTQYLAQKLFLNLKTFNGLNMAMSTISQVHFAELGIIPTAQSLLNLLNINKNLLKDNSKITYLYNNIDKDNFKLTLKNKIVFCNLNTHQQSGNLKQALYTMPINSFFEKDSLNINLEGRIQKSFKSITPLPLSRNSEDIFKALLKIHNPNKKNCYTNTFLFLKNPFLKTIGYQRNSFYLSYLKLHFTSQKIFFTPFKSAITNFYMTDNISKNSKIMAECSLFLKNKSNFLSN